MNKHAKLMEERRAAIDNTIASGDPVGSRMRQVYDAFESSYTCHSEYRRGRALGDGGKFVCGDQEYFKTKKCLVYSVGSNGDASFERDAARTLGCEVHTFDPFGNSTRYRATVESAGAVFHTIGVNGSPSHITNAVTGLSARLLPIQDIMRMLGHEGRGIDILKIDCEGCEYDAFASLWEHVQSGAVQVGQIQVELHGTAFRRVASFFDGADAAGYMIFHKERNQWGCDGYKCVEFSLIHTNEARRIFEFTHCN